MKISYEMKHYLIALIPLLGMVVIIEPNITMFRWYRVVALGIQCITITIMNGL
jgi:hypothetical protein